MTFFAALDIALDKIQRRIERYKGKHYRGRGNGIPAAEYVMESDFPEEETNELGPVISRRKQFLLSPMDEMEALDQMELLGHQNFFIFSNANTNSINILYRRRNGTYGLIEPEIG